MSMYEEEPVVDDVVIEDGDLDIPDYVPQESLSVSADARSRAGRTFVQGLIVAALLSAITIAGNNIATATSWSDVDWQIISFAVVQAAITAVVSYVSRFVSDPPA